MYRNIDLPKNNHQHCVIISSGLPLPKGPAACCIGSLLLLGPLLDPLKICRPRAVSRKSQILSATFLISRPCETLQDCKETHMFSVSSKPLSLDDSPFFFWKFCCELPLISRDSRPRAPIGASRKTESNTGAFRTHFGTWIYSRFFFEKTQYFQAPEVPTVVILPQVWCNILQCREEHFARKWHLGFEIFVRLSEVCKFLG